MFVEEIRRAVQAAPRHRLAEISAAVWKGFAAGAIMEEEAQRLAEEIEARKVIPSASATPRKPVGSRPRSPASLERRRAWTGSGWASAGHCSAVHDGRGRGDWRDRGRDRKARPVRALHRRHRRPGRGVCAPRSSSAPCVRPGASACCTSKHAALPAIGACRTSSRLSVGRSSYGSAPEPGSRGKGVGAHPCRRAPIIF